MSATPFEHPFLSGLLGDITILALFDATTDIEMMLRFEAELAMVQADCAVIPVAAATAIEQVCQSFTADMAQLRTATTRDGVVVPELVRQLRAAVTPEHAVYVHFGATSQDVIDTSLVLRLRTLAQLLGERINAVITLLNQLDQAHGQRRLMAKTRMQSALAIRVSDRIDNWRRPLVEHLRRLEAIMERVLVVQFGGAVGTLDKLGAAGLNVRQRLAERLDLAVPDAAWHSQRAALAEFAGWLSLVSGSLGKLGIDVGLMAQNEIAVLTLSSGGRSSAMAHKQNPIDAEVLVSLARFNGVLLSGMHQALVHEQERSGAAWTLEWLILPQMAVATGAALNAAERLLGAVSTMGVE